jgi:hypothetical protein
LEITNRLKNAFQSFRGTPKQKNSGVDGNAFLKYGSRRSMPSMWSEPEITDEAFYTGYGFAVINKRANRSATIGKNYLFTNANKTLMDSANEKGDKLEHPYLQFIKSSSDFSERDFWYNISTYLDLEGIFYLMAVRTVTASGAVGNVQSFKLLNPYNVRPVIDQSGTLGGYTERRVLGNATASRDIPKEMIIPVKLLNPFNNELPYSLADAARDSQFTLKQANDYARESINGNINSPGIISTAIELPDDQFDNFVERVKNHGRGEPLFGNGSGTVGWTSMQTDLDKAALDKINSISRDALLAVSGTSKSGMGVEEAGAGREVSRTQKDDFTENAVMPQVENIIDALNLDYRRYYPDLFKKNGYAIALDNPLLTDRESELVDVQVRDAEFKLLGSLMTEGYDFDSATKYAKGLIGITDLAKPKKKPTPPVAPVTPVDPTMPPDPMPPAKDPKVPPVPPAKKPNAAPKANKLWSVYEGYPMPVLQYLDGYADQVTPFSESSSFIYSAAQPQEKVHVSRVEARGNSLIAVVDDDTFIRLGEFKPDANQTAILGKLNKRYHNQAVAIKQKIEHECGDVYEVIKNAAFDKMGQIESNTADLKSSAEAAENQIFQWYLDALSSGLKPDLPSDKLDQFINSLTLPFAVYFTVMFPIYASFRVRQTAEDLGITDELPIVALTEEIKGTIKQFALKEATSHINTINNDIKNALANILGVTSNLEEVKNLFALEFQKIQARRAEAIANNAAARIFNLSQYEADLQFLTRAGKVTQAYKELYSLTGTPCQFCSAMIAATHASPIPFKSNFADLGSSIEADGDTMNFNFENITAGNIHVSCRCVYRLIML